MIIEFNPNLKKRKTLTELLHKNSLYSDELNEWLNNNIIKNNSSDLFKKSFKQFMIKNIWLENKLKSEIIIWIQYIENLLIKAFSPEFIKDFYVTDHMIKYNNSSNPSDIKHWADIAFLRWSIFPWSQKIMWKNDYKQIAKTLYYNRYMHTKLEIWWILRKHTDTYANAVEKFINMN